MPARKKGRPSIPKAQKKLRVNLSLSPKIVEDAEEFIKNESIPSISALVEMAIRNEIKTRNALDEKNITPIRFSLPLLGGVAAGAQIDAVIDDSIAVIKHFPEDHYALRVFGRSMEPDILDGSAIVVKRWHNKGYPAAGTIVVYSDGQGSSLKKISYRAPQQGEETTGHGLVPVLSSINPKFPDVQTMDGGRIDAVFVEILNAA
ncbi:MAG: S24 family peptidase [Luteolibacter sp.]